jgi:hypothetical protein
VIVLTAAKAPVSQRRMPILGIDIRGPGDLSLPLAMKAY